MLAVYTAENVLVRGTQLRIGEIESQIRAMETEFPALVGRDQIDSGNNPIRMKLATERAKLDVAATSVEKLKLWSKEIEQETKTLSEYGPIISELERKREVDEKNLKYFQSSLQQARVDEALDSSKIPNISVVQNPSPAVRVTAETNKLLLALAAGGIALGVSLALLIEMVLDRSVKRPGEFRKHLQIPLIFSIPRLGGSRHAASGPARLPGPAALATAPVREGKSERITRLFRPFCAEIRDRLILFFEINRMSHKPKLVAVTGCTDGVGVSAIASGLAATLSETGDGKVLLVDMNPGSEGVRPFFAGNDVRSISDALNNAGREAPHPINENLYLATATSDGNGGGEGYLFPKRFYDLLPRFKASQFDYIIFDMPSLQSSSATLAMSGFMDKVLLVAEAETTTKGAVKRGYQELLAAKANVSCVLNKAPTDGPRWFES
jgi:Mrp family chromosome partitioning ATPase